MGTVVGVDAPPEALSVPLVEEGAHTPGVQVQDYHTLLEADPLRGGGALQGLLCRRQQFLGASVQMTLTQ